MKVLTAYKRLVGGQNNIKNIELLGNKFFFSKQSFRLMLVFVIHQNFVDLIHTQKTAQ